MSIKEVMWEKAFENLKMDASYLADDIKEINKDDYFDENVPDEMVNKVHKRLYDRVQKFQKKEMDVWYENKKRYEKTVADKDAFYYDLKIISNYLYN